MDTPSAHVRARTARVIYGTPQAYLRDILGRLGAAQAALRSGDPVEGVTHDLERVTTDIEALSLWLASYGPTARTVGGEVTT